MTVGSENDVTLEMLEARLVTILPEEYQDCYEDVQPVSMGSAGLKYGPDGKVAWDEMWATFCDLAMAGGPPHKGKLLEPATQFEIEAEPERYEEVIEEICRGVAMVTELPVDASPVAGWVRVGCENDAMAAWLVRAIAMENVSIGCEGSVVELPAGPNYRIEKEVKNVVTVIAKTCHYWQDHMWSGQQRDIAELFAKLAVESPLTQPALVGHDFEADKHQLVSGKLAAAIQQATRLQASDRHYAGWLGLECQDIRAAIWMMRGMVASNVVARREDAILFVPVNPVSDSDGTTVARCLARVHGFAKVRAIL